jgi:hypothetical protein
MKQAHKASRGANRRGREKRRGRNIGERGKLAGKWTLDAVAAMGKETPRKVLEAREGVRAGPDRSVLCRGGEAHERMNPELQGTGGRQRGDIPRRPAGNSEATAGAE